MRRSRSPSPSFRALAHHQAAAGGPGASDPMSLVRSFNVESNPTRPVRPSPLATSAIKDMPLDLVDRIRSFPLFMSAPEDFLVAVGNHLRPQIHIAQDHILREGDEAKAMYWLVRGVVAVTSRDGEAVYAELKAGAFFGEIGILMDMPRTATVTARTKCLLLVLKKEDLQAVLPRFPDMEKAIRQEAQERLTILRKKRQERGLGGGLPSGSNIARHPAPGEVSTGEKGAIKDGAAVLNTKKRKSPSPGAGVVEAPAAGSALGSGLVNVRETLKELPLFSTLPADILHFLGLSAQPKTYAPFTDIIRQGAQGNDIFFIVRGEAEVIHEPPQGKEGRPMTHRTFYQRPRLRQGQYFGEVASLGLSRGRTATVRAITTVECLMIGGDALDELWKRCPSGIREQVEETARTRYGAKAAGGDEDTEMTDANGSAVGRPMSPAAKLGAGLQPLPQVTFTNPSKPSSPSKIGPDGGETMEPGDPDPFLSVDMENLRNRRRSSLAPPTGTGDGMGSPTTPNGLPSVAKFLAPFMRHSPSPTEPEIPWKRARTIPHSRASSTSINELNPRLPDGILLSVFRHLDVAQLMRLRLVCARWRDLLTTSEELCRDVNLAPYSRRVTDAVLAGAVAPFVGTRAESVDISNCFHVTDEGFAALWRICGSNVRVWRMRSVWDVSANQILEMSEAAKGLEEVDLSNCRKVGDNLLARVVGWVVPEMPGRQAVPGAGAGAAGSRAPAAGQKLPAHQGQQQQQQQQQKGKQPRPTSLLPPGTVVGCPRLKRLNLSYCKHVTDRSMAHLAAHAHPRLEALTLTRCTSITDAGFQSWAPFHFSHLRSLSLADCTYLTDAATVALVNAAKQLERLDLSFCCALTDTSTEVIALGLPKLKELRLAFCGSAVSDGSLGCVALHLGELRGLSVRGCVRVTGAGAEAVLDGCERLEWLDASQCRNLEGWVRGGGVGRWGFDDRSGRQGGQGAGVSVKEEMRNLTVEEGPRGGVGGGGGPGLGGFRPFGRGFGRARRARKPVRFILEKGPKGLR